MTGYVNNTLHHFNHVKPKSTTSTIFNTKKNIWRRCSKQEADGHVTNTIWRESEANWTNSWIIIILRVWCKKHVNITINCHGINNWPYWTILEECKPIIGLHCNPSKCSRPFSRFRHYFTRQYRCVGSEWTTITQLWSRIFLLKKDTLKMYAWSHKWTSTCTLQHFKICCRLFSRSRNRGLFCNGKRCHHSTNMLEEMGHPQPITQVCTDNIVASGIANDAINQQRYRALNMRFCWILNQKNFENFLIAWKKRTRKSCKLFYKTSFCKASQICTSDLSTEK